MLCSLVYSMLDKSIYYPLEAYLLWDLQGGSESRRYWVWRRFVQMFGRWWADTLAAVLLSHTVGSYEQTN